MMTSDKIYTKDISDSITESLWGEVYESREIESQVYEEIYATMKERYKKRKKVVTEQTALSTERPHEAEFIKI